jgi:hypothetical protein
MNRIHHTILNTGPGLLPVCALVALMSMGLPVQAADGGNSGGDWYGSNRLSSCGDVPDDSYLGACGTGAGQLSGQDVLIVDGAPGIVAGAFGVGSETVSGNRVTVRSGVVGDWVYGGKTDGGIVMNNTVVVQGGTINGWVRAGHSESGPAISNRVEISGGTVNGSINGGYSYASSVANNVVSVSGTAVIRGDIYGGVSRGGSLSGNQVILSGEPDMSTSTLYGGFVTPGGSGTSAGNVLVVRTQGLKAQNVQDFQEYHFILPAGIKNNDTVLTLGSGMNLDTFSTLGAVIGTDLRGAKVGVALAAGGNVLQTGDRVTLIHNDDGLQADDTIRRADMSGYQGVSLNYTFDVAATGTDLYATATQGASVMEQTKAPVEGRASTMAMTTQAGDLTAGEGMARALGATEGVSGTATFGATAGGTSRYHSGSHVDATGLSIMVGAAKRFPLAQGQWMAGVFVEGGYGSYDTYNDIAGQATVHGSGKSRYFGGGALVRRDWAADGQAGPYAEGSVRLGRVSSDWGSRTMIGAGDASYDTAAMYYGAHAGVGYILPLSEKTALDAHVKGFWTHQDGDSVSIAGDPYEFKAMDSFRSRLGLRLTRAVTEQVTAYVGAAWEHEFDGKARATTYGLDTPSPSLEGDTGVFELGFDMKPKADGPLTVGLGVQGYTGMREGVSGTAKLMWVF